MNLDIQTGNNVVIERKMQRESLKYCTSGFILKQVKLIILRIEKTKWFYERLANLYFL